MGTGGTLSLIRVALKVGNTPLMSMRDARQAVDALHDLSQENLVLLVGLFALHLHVGDQLHALN